MLSAKEEGTQWGQLEGSAGMQWHLAIRMRPEVDERELRQ